ncbi:tRNA A64-2'-O-ribosylphosphate transferase [Halteromyces radiatus]|uniref:tRNA A64-2'-O-ribosylphosphate transferase n=1 Tax=Halteromyces radiatus TaxID=101107 RepID=UPI00221EADE5|nr:tRNA A64-2'-O-ribosylphosphate transferase [Halteromyces radiatus]KAI8093707.1 tRNA A64-2'-O-ribosylphosphate transferase [Halteromyces radiatus]
MIRFEHEVDQIRKDHKKIYNRLKSIQEDALFVDKVAHLYPHLALVANERCGSWYINPTKHKVHSVYFKSTDGHMGEWDFNVRRGNFHIIDIIAAHQGCIIVDSTRRGKRIPDALSKTIPIWCCVINRAIQRYYQQEQQQPLSKWDDRFHSLPTAVFRSEHAQIEARLDGFVQKLWDLGVDVERLAKLLKKPLRPIWLTPQSSLSEAMDYTDCEFYPVICVSASQFIQDGGCQARPDGYLYVQGSADDQEAWSMGLTCSLFWTHDQEILRHPSTCETTVEEIVEQARQERHQQLQANGQDLTLLRLENDIKNTMLTIGNRYTGLTSSFDAVIQCCCLTTNKKKKTWLDLAIPEGKKGQHVLEKAIPLAITFARPFLANHQRILVFSVDGKNRAVGIALALLVHYYDENGNLELDGVKHVTKDSIRQKLIQLIASHPQAAPSRVTLRRVNTHFLSVID